MKKLLAIVLLGFSSLIGAQQTQTTNNLITGVPTGTIPYTGTGGGYSGGSTPGYNATNNTIYFGYNQGTAAHTIAINNALSGSGVQVGGYNYSWQYINQDMSRGTLNAAVKLTNPSGAVLEQYTYAHPQTTNGWTTVSGTQNFNQRYGLSSVGNLSVGFTGKDDRWWAGYYGPQVRNVNLSLNYTVDPCVTNPAYSSNCSNYNTVKVSDNLVPNPGAYAYGGWSIDQSYAINQALGQTGANVMIHGFQWGYVANANGPYCGSWDMGIFGCWDLRTPAVTTNVNITDNNNNSIYSVSRTYTNSYNTTNYQYLFPSSRNLLTLGSFNFTATTNDQNAYVGSMWSKALYTPDPCTVNPLSSTSCPGYQQAYHDQQCSINPLYASDCPGYSQAFLTQQCSANVLYSPSCPGYAQAYHDQQCSISPLFASDCPGYAQAYHDQQCSINPLYMSDCRGYAQAYLTQQCNINPLYSTQCTGYAAAYKSQQCSLNPLYATDCPGYAQAYFNQQCSLNGLYDRTCPNYSTAYATKNLLTTTNTTTTTTTAPAPTAPVATTTTETTTASTNPATTAISDTTVSSAITPPTTTSATSVTSVTSVVTTVTPTAANPVAAATSAAATPPPVVVTPAAAAAQAVETKKTDTAVASVEKKAGGNQAAAKAAATERAKELANEASKAATLEAQAATQGVVVGLMGYVPGFTAYQNSIVPDVNVVKMARQYNKPVVDNRNAQRRLSGANEQKWQEMVDLQYNNNKGN